MTGTEPWIWNNGPSGLTLDGGIVSFQRFGVPSDKMVQRAPSSCGALPIAKVGERFVLAVPDQEAFWIGVIIPGDWKHGEWRAAVLNAGGKLIEIERLAHPGIFVIPGLLRPDGGYDVFWRQAVSEIQLIGKSGVARIVVSDPRTYFVCSGQPPPGPLDPDAVFGGFRLP